MDLDPIFSTDIQPNHTLFTFCSTVLYFTTNTFFHIIQLILCFQQTGEIDTLTESLGQSILVVLCAGSWLLLTPSNFLAPLLLVNQQPLWKRLSSPTGSIKPWFLTAQSEAGIKSWLELFKFLKAYREHKNIF